MNRSGRRVIGATIAAGVLCAGPGGLCAATSSADPAGIAAPDASEKAGPPVGGKPDPGWPRGRSNRWRPGHSTSAGQAKPDRPVRWPWKWPCHRPPQPPRPPVPAWTGLLPVTTGNNNWIFVAQLAVVAPVAPTARISGGVQRAGPDPALPGWEPVGIPAPRPALSSPARPALSSPARPALSSPARPALSSPARPALSSPARPASDRVAPPQGQGTESPSSWRLGYPEELRQADIAKVLALALPGLAAIAGMTALGGVLGYRQARAGYVLRAAGAGRFLQ